MKKRMRRVLGAALSLVMAVGLLSGCSSYDPVKEVMGYSRSTVMFTVNGNDVTAGHGDRLVHPHGRRYDHGRVCEGAVQGSSGVL